MESYSIDVDPEQVARWLMAEQAAGSLRLRLSARRLAEVRRIPLQAEFHLGDEEREDLSEITMIGTLEIAPLHASDGFYREFLWRGRGTASIEAEVDGPEGEAHLARLIDAIETNSHPNGRRARKH